MLCGTNHCYHLVAPQGGAGDSCKSDAGQLMLWNTFGLLCFDTQTKAEIAGEDGSKKTLYGLRHEKLFMQERLSRLSRLALFRDSMNSEIEFSEKKCDGKRQPRFLCLFSLLHIVDQ